jgi:hypothetical protein
VVRPIEANQGIMQAHATEKIQKIQQQHPDMQQKYFSIQLQEEHKRQQEKVSEAEEAKKKSIDAEQEKNRERNNRESENKRKHIADDPNAESSLMLEQGVHHIDIKA